MGRIQLPSTSTARQRRRFYEAAEKQAEFIRGGGLIEPAGHMQLDPSSHEPLALINAAGLVTYNGQDALNYRTGKPVQFERSYVEGFMLPDEAFRFVNKINFWNDDKVAFVQVRLSDYIQTLSGLALNRDFDVASRSYINAGQATWMTKSDENRNKQQVGLPKRIPVSFVVVFDTKWGRPATSKRGGLFEAILRALDTDIEYPHVEGDPYIFLKTDKPDDEERYTEYRAGRFPRS